MATEPVPALDALDGQVELAGALIKLRQRMGNLRQGVSSAWKSTGQYLKKLIASISGHLWQLISKLLTLKEWTVGGDAGVSLFGLQGNVKIELTFGK